MNKRLDPTNDIREDRTFVDMGDKASTYIFGEDATHFCVGNGNKGEAHLLLKEISKTNDGKVKWGEANNGDGGHRKRLEIQNEDGTAADDFVALIEAAIKGEAGLSFKINAADEIEIHAPGRWSTDILKFSGEYVTDALKNAKTGFDLQNHTDQFKVFTFEDDGNQQNIYTGGGRDLAQGESVFDNFFNASMLNEGAELEAVVNAALDDHYGLKDTTDMEVVSVTGDSLVFEITTEHWRADPGTVQKTFILNGGTVENLIADYKGGIGSGINPQDNNSQTAYYDTDTNAGGTGGVWVGGGSQGVTFDANETINLKGVVGNGINQREDNPNRAWQDDIDEFVFNALNYDGESDVEVIAGGEKGDDFLTVAMQADQGQTDTVILEGERVGDAIDHFVDTGMQFDFFA